MYPHGRSLMRKREDSKETRKKLLNAACEVFAKKGYHNAKIADICRQAGANIAAVNYHFKDKKKLYSETWRYSFKQFDDLSVFDPIGNQPEEILRNYVQNLMQSLSINKKTGYFSRLYMAEILNPTGLIQDLWHELIEPQRKKLHDIIREIAGQQTDMQNIIFCELSIVNQCRTLVTIKHKDLEYILGQTIDHKLIAKMAEHIADFSLAGIKAVGEH